MGAVTASTLTVGLVACGKTKATKPMPARELYTGGLFKAASAYATSTYDRWWIISAFHGLVEPDQVLHPYDRSLPALRQAEREAWGQRVASLLRSRLQGLGLSVPPVLPVGSPWPHDPQVELWVHAGKAYVDALLWPLRFWPCTVNTPLEGLGIGEQLRWYRQQRESAA